MQSGPIFAPQPTTTVVAVPFDPKTNRVFISHGKQRAVATQIKELLAFGSFEPVVSMDRESTAIPVPEKVFEDMRSCGAGVIHVGGKGKYLDRDKVEHSKINDNVLIEIGAAMALYGKKVVLLVEKGVTLPSNLQGLYRCDFEGDKLDYEATMKLLKTFSQFLIRRMLMRAQWQFPRSGPRAINARLYSERRSADGATHRFRQFPVLEKYSGSVAENSRLAAYGNSPASASLATLFRRATEGGGAEVDETVFGRKWDQAFRERHSISR